MRVRNEIKRSTICFTLLVIYTAIEVEQETNTKTISSFIGAVRNSWYICRKFQIFHSTCFFFDIFQSDIIGFPFGDYAIAGRKRNISVAPDSAALSSVKTLINVDLQRIPLEGDEMLRSSDSSHGRGALFC